MTKPHWLAPGAKTWTPSVIVHFDTETIESESGTDLLHQLRCWDAVCEVRHNIAPGRSRRRTVAGELISDLVDLIEDYSTLDRETWVVAHNLNFDLTVTALPAVLVGRAWHVEAYGMSKESNWWVLKRDGKKLVIVDSWSWLPDSLDNLAKDIGRRKLRLPKNDASLEEWHRRCRHDAVILADLFTTILDWWDAEQLGRFGITSAGCGWSTLRSKSEPKTLVVGPAGGKTDFERLAIYGGWKEVWWIGELHGEWVADYDFVAAYPTIAAHHRLPNGPGTYFRHLPEGIVPGFTEGKDVIARCTVTTDRPVVPVRIDHDVWYPTGTFKTVLTGPEIAYASSVGASVEVQDGYWYPMAFALRPWAIWCLSLLTAPATSVPPLVRRMAKGWSRSVIGRFAGHTSRVTLDRPAVGSGWRLETGHNLDSGRPLEVLTIGDREITTEHDLDAADSFPAVLAFVEARCRVALHEAVDSRNPSYLLQANTDGWWERRAVRSAAYEVEGVPWPHHVIRKASTNGAVILGPDHVTTPSERRLAGIPKNADGNFADGWQWHDWPGLRWQLERSAAGYYTRPKRELDMQAHYARRWVLTTGETVPVTVRTDEVTGTVVLPWEDTQGRRNSDVLAAYQDDRLEPLRGAGHLVPTLFDGSGPRLPGRRDWGLSSRPNLRLR